LGRVQPIELERMLNDEDYIVSKTDLKGRIIYCNKIFVEISGYSESELLGKPHSIIRHPDMPKIVFKLLWDRIKKKQDIFAFVKNLCKDGGYYWVFANVTATLDTNGNIRDYWKRREEAAWKLPKSILEICWSRKR